MTFIDYSTAWIRRIEEPALTTRELAHNMPHEFSMFAKVLVRSDVLMTICYVRKDRRWRETAEDKRGEGGEDRGAFLGRGGLVLVSVLR